MAAKRTSRKGTSNRGARAALTIAAAILILFTFASLVFHYFVNRPASTNYCGPLGYWVARGLDVAFGVTSLFLPIVLALVGLLVLRRGKGWRPLSAALAWLLGFCLLVALLAYQLHSSGDPAGAVGKWLAGGLLMGLGFGAYAVVALAVPWGLNLLQKRSVAKDVTQSGFILLMGLYLNLFLAYFGGRWSLSGPPPQSAPYPLGGKAGLGIVRGLEQLCSRN